MILNQQQKNAIQSSIESGRFNLEAEVEKLISKGFTKEEALAQIKLEADACRQKLFDQKVKGEAQEEHQKIAFGVLAMLGFAGPFFDISSLYWYILASIIAAGVGYWAYKDKPIAGMVTAVSYIVIFPLFYNWYINGRNSIIRIEVLIPIALTMVASFIIWLLLSNILYSKKN